MRGQVQALLFGILTTVLGGWILAGVEKMLSPFLFEFFKYMSPLIAGGVVYLMVRTIQFHQEKHQMFQEVRHDVNREILIFKEALAKEVLSSIASRQEAIKNIWVQETHEWLAGEVDARFKRIEEQLKLAPWTKSLYQSRKTENNI
jgi:hypothetical protein